MEKTNLLIILISITLILTFINLYGTYNLYSKFDSITGKIVKEQNAQTAPTANGQQQPSRIQVSSDGNPAKGNKDASVTIVEFSDFQCPYCGRFFAKTLPSIEENYIKTGKAKLVFRNFPLGFHPNAQKAAEASECANEQDKFWEYHDKLFENQNELDALSLKKFAKDLGLDSQKFDACLDSGKMASEVLKDFSDGSKYGVSGTPTFFINGISLVGAQSYASFQQIIEQELNINK